MEIEIVDLVQNAGLLGLVPLVRQVVKEASQLWFVKSYPTVAALVISSVFFGLFIALPEAWQSMFSFASLVAGLTSVYNDQREVRKSEIEKNMAVARTEPEDFDLSTSQN